MVRARMHTYMYVHKLTDPSTYDAVHCKAAWPDPNLGCKLWRTQAAQKLGWKQHHTAVPNCRGYLLSWGGRGAAPGAEQLGLHAGRQQPGARWEQQHACSRALSYSFICRRGQSFHSAEVLREGQPPGPPARGQPWLHRTRLAQVSSAPAPWWRLCPLSGAVALCCEMLHL